MRVVAVVLLAACWAPGHPAPPAPTPAPATPPAPPPHGPAPVARAALPPPVAMPTLDALFGLVVPRPPVPTDEPHFDLVAAFGATGSWIGLCDARREPRVGGEDARAYLAAWCAIARSDNDRTRSNLARLAHVRTRSIADAVARDVIGLLAVRAGPEDALDALDRYHVDGVLELAEAYAMLDRPSEALAVLATVPRKAPARVRCEALLWALQLGLYPTSISAEAATIDHPVCHSVVALASCPVAVQPVLTPTHFIDVTCHQTLEQLPDAREWLFTVAALSEWPTGPVGARNWLDLAVQASQGPPGRDLDTIVETALEAGLQALPCDDAERARYADVVKDVRNRRRLVGPAVSRPCAP